MSENDEFCITNEKLCIKNEGLCINIKDKDLCIYMMNSEQHNDLLIDGGSFVLGRDGRGQFLYIEMKILQQKMRTPPLKMKGLPLRYGRGMIDSVFKMMNVIMTRSAMGD